MRQDSRRGFTLIELLVVIAIIGVLIALLLPAVQAAREAARRSQCSNNLKQLGLAIANYESALSSLPWGAGPNPSTAGNNTPSSLALLLPYMEQKPLYDAMNLSGTYKTDDTLNATVLKTKINSFLCPSDVDRLTLGLGGTNYQANAGSDAFTFQKGSSRFSGAFAGLGTVSTLSAITDGTSNTASFAEVVKGIGTVNTWDSLKPPGGVLKFATKGSTGATDDGFTDKDNCSKQAPGSGNMTAGLPLGGSWVIGRSGQTRFTTVMPPNTWHCAFENKNTDEDQAAITASSRHSGLINCLLLDASVRSVKNSVDAAIWRGVGTKSNGEIVSDF